MKEANILTPEDSQNLLAFMESCFNTTIPCNKQRFGEISFHLYKYEKQEDPEWVFQIRWGSHPLYSKKHLKLNSEDEYLSQLFSIIKNNKSSIIKASIDFCEDQLNNVALLEIEPELNKRLPLLSNYKIFIRKMRPNKVREASERLQNYGVCISFLDETGEFQEFVHPIPYNTQNGYFNLSAPEIVTKFQRFQDQVAF